MKIITKLSLSLATLLMLGITSLQAQNLIQNGSFEYFTSIKENNNWKRVQLENWNEVTKVKLNGLSASDGTYKVSLDSGTRTNSLSQTITTIVDTTYVLSVDAYSKDINTSDFEMLIDEKVITRITPTSIWENYSASFIGTGKVQSIEFREMASQNNRKGAVLDNVSLIVSVPNIELIEALTDGYKNRWFNPAKVIWNQAHQDEFVHEYFTYKFPKTADFVAGTPKDEPMTPMEWMGQSGIGFSKKIDIPSERGIYNYDDALVKSWKAKGFRAGRFHLSASDFVDIDNDATGMTLKQSGLDELKRACQVFVDNDIPVLVSMNGTGELINDMKNNPTKTFQLICEWWRQIAEHLKDMSHLVAFENFVEYHGFEGLEEELKFGVLLENNEIRYPNFQNYRNRKIDNWVRSPLYNNLMAEIAKVVRVTNPTRIFIYKPNGIGRGSMVNITPWRWESEADPLKEDAKQAYWLMSVGGSANLKAEFIMAQRETNSTKREALLDTVSKNSWRPAVRYFNGTKIPVWISLFGVKVDAIKVDEYLDGIPPSSKEVTDYVAWYQTNVQTKALLESGERVRVPSAFQQSWWLWDFKSNQWKEGDVSNLTDVENITETLSSYTFSTTKAKHFPPAYINNDMIEKEVIANQEYRDSLVGSVAYDKNKRPTFEKVSGATWLNISTDGNISGTPTQADIGENSFRVKASNDSGQVEFEFNIAVVDYEKVTLLATDDSYCQVNKLDVNYGTKTTIILNNINAVARVGFIQFDLSGIEKNILTASLGLYSKSFEGNITIHEIVDNSWNEDELTWSNKPTIGESIKVVSVQEGEKVSIDLTAFIKENKKYSFAIITSENILGDFHSKEGGKSPEMVLELE